MGTAPVMSRRQIIAALAAATLSFGAAACGDRESNEGNDDQPIPAGTPDTVEQNPSGVTPTGETEPTITDEE